MDKPSRDPRPFAVGKDPVTGRIVVEYEDTPEARDMARRFASSMFDEDDVPTPAAQRDG